MKWADMVEEAKRRFLGDYRRAMRNGNLPPDAGNPERVWFQANRFGGGGLYVEDEYGQVWSPYYAQNTSEELTSCYITDYKNPETGEYLYLPSLYGIYEEDDLIRPPFITEEDFTEWRADAIDLYGDSPTLVENYVKEQVRKRIGDIVSDAQLDEEAVLVYLSGAQAWDQVEWMRQEHME